MRGRRAEEDGGFVGFLRGTTFEPFEGFDLHDGYFFAFSPRACAYADTPHEVGGT